MVIVLERSRDDNAAFLCAYGPFKTFDEAEAKCVEWRKKYPSCFSVGRIDPDPSLFYDQFPDALNPR